MIQRILCAFVICTCSLTNAADDKRPNVLFIAIDDLNDWVGCLEGHPQAKTPHIDALAGRGVNFRSAHCQAPICNCSRVSMLLGKHASTTGMYFLAPNFRAAERTKDETTLFQYFRQHGYYTSTCGKIFHGKPDPASFDHIEATRGWRRDRKKVRYQVQGSNPLWDWGQVETPDEQQRDFRTAAWAVEELKRLSGHDQPWFLSIGFHLPHVPLYASRKWFDLYPLQSLQLPVVRENDRNDLSDYAKLLTVNPTAPRHSWMVENDEWKHAVQAYLACTSFVDSLVGTVLAGHKSSGTADNTIIVLWSDHGFHLGEKQRWAKRTLWEDSTRVPLIISGTGIAPGNCDAPVGLIDIFPTLNSLCHLPEKDDLEGQSLINFLTAPETSGSTPVRTTFGPGNHSLRMKDGDRAELRFIHYSDGSEELYDHLKDPHEWHNIIDDPQYTQYVRQLRKCLPAVEAAPLPGSRGSDSPLYGEAAAISREEAVR